MNVSFLSRSKMAFLSVVTVVGCFNLYSIPANSYSKYKFEKLLVEYAENPIGIDEMHPRFSWIISSEKWNQVQTAFRIQVGSSPAKLNGNKPDLWDSGRIESSETIQQEYLNDNLKSNSSYYWKVIFWDGVGKSHESPVAKFETAFLSEDEWIANWIGKGPKSELLPQQGFYKDIKEQFPGKDTIVHDGNSLLLRDEVQLNKKIKSAKAYITGLGFHELFKPKEVNVSKDGMKVYDMGQNFSGWVRIKAKAERNTILKIRFAEDLNSDGTIDVTSNEHANATAEYIMKGKEMETYETHFSYFGFKYVEITAQNGPFNILDIEGHAVYSANNQTGKFECDNELVNKIHKATVWSQKSNMLGYPIDCPQRDERLGWMGDAQVTAVEAMFNFDMALFYENWFEGIKDNQDEKTGDIPIISPRPYIKDDGIEWSSTYLTMLWQYYSNYGDKRILQRHYQAMKRYMNFLDSISKDLILPMGWIGDWGSMVKDWKEGQPESVPTAFYFLDAKIMADVAGVTGNIGDQKYFRKLSSEIRDKYNMTYLNTETGNYNDGSQMANSFPLYLGIVPDEIKKKVMGNLVNDIVVRNSTHLMTGVLGTKYMPEALAKEGRGDIAWGIINQKSPPSWNDMMSKYTTMCEFWTLKQSKNHVMMGSIDAWFYKYIAGIQLDENNPAFSSFQVKPLLLDSLRFGKAQIETMRGRISSEWERNQGLFTLKLEIPFNTSAMVYIPGSVKSKVLESEVPIGKVDGTEYLGFKNGVHILKVHSGNYLFTTITD